MKDLYVSYGMVKVIYGVNLKVDSGELVPVTGPNGMGRTTPIKATVGLVPFRSGSVLYDGQDISALPAHKRAEMGIGYVPEGRHIFGGPTVEESLWIDTYRLPDTEQIRPNLQKVYGMFPRLGERKNQLTRAVSGEGQQILVIDRTLVLSPRLLLIDKVSTGLIPIMVNTCFQVIEKLNESGVTILMVEQNTNKTLKIANRRYVIEADNITLEDTPEVLHSNDMVQKAYLGS